MIIKGASRGRSQQLAAHLLNREQNERIHLYETRGTVATELADALAEMEAHAAAFACKRPLYHASLSPEAHTPLTQEQIRVAVDTLEEALGLTNQARVIVVHEKNAREHVHVVWSRLDMDRQRVIPDSWNYRHHEHAARALEALFGHRPVPGSKQSRPRPGRKDYEQWQQHRSGVSAGDVTKEVTALWQRAANAEAFVATLDQAGYRIARGDRRAFVIIDRHGEVHSLARRIEGLSVRDVQSRLQHLDRSALPSVSEARKKRTRVPPPMLMTATFIKAAREVTHTQWRRPQLLHRARMIRSKPNASVHGITEQVQISVGIKRLRPSARRADAGSQFGSKRAIIISTFAARLTDVRKNCSESELDAAIAALVAEREAALERLSGEESSIVQRRKRSRAGTLAEVTRNIRFRRRRVRKGMPPNVSR